MTDIKTHYRTCNICEAMCGIEIQHKGSEIISIKGNKEDVFSRGHICPKAVALQDYYHDPDRLKTPIKKVNGQWQDISWNEAFAEVTQRLRKIQSQYGSDAVGVYLGNPNAHNFGNALYLPGFFKALGSMSRYSSASADQLPHHVASSFMLGNGMLIPIPDIDRTDYWLIVGGNPIVSNGSMMTAPGVDKRMKGIRERGGKTVVIDPRRTETAKKADEHHFIQPETDALFLAAIIHTLFEESLFDLGHLRDRVNGLAEIEVAVQQFAPEQVAAHCGIDSEDIRQLAREFSHANSAVCYARMGASTQSFGGLCQWLNNLLNILTGNFDSEGGAMFPQPAFELMRPSRGKPHSFSSVRSRVNQMPYFNREFPVATLTDEITTPGDGQIRSLISIAGNPVLSSPNGEALGKAFEQLEFMVAIDIYLNETTQHADIILPATTGLEVAHFDIFFNAFSVRNTAKFSTPLFTKQDDQRHDWEILKALTAGLQGGVEDDTSPEEILDHGLKHGAYGPQGMSLSHLKANPNGVDLGALRPCLSERIQTEDRSIELAPDLFLADIPRLASVLTSTVKSTDYPFKLISRRLVRNHNTWTHNAHRLIKGKDPVTLQMNPRDAATIGCVQGESVTVTSRVGKVTLPLDVNDDIAPGVVSMPQGWGHHKGKIRMRVATTQPGVSINNLTDANRVDELTGNAAFNGTPVRVAAAS